ncbi:MAG: DinB family protein, partial [Acidobacteriota bacterium]
TMRSNLKCGVDNFCNRDLSQHNIACKLRTLDQNGTDDRADLPPAEWRAQIMGHFRTAGRQLDAAVAGWSDRQLDTLRLEHPILGAMTVRELLYFTLYHNAHHARRIRERAG